MPNFHRSLGKRAAMFVCLEASSINRPHFSATWFDKDRLNLSFTWGNGYTDPVLMFDLELYIPAWLEKRLP